MTIETGSREFDEPAPPTDYRPRLLAALAELDTLEVRPVGIAVDHAGRTMTLFPTDHEGALAWDAVADVDDILAEEPSGFVVGRGATISAALEDCGDQADAAEDPDRDDDIGGGEEDDDDV